MKNYFAHTNFIDQAGHRVFLLALILTLSSINLWGQVNNSGFKTSYNLAPKSPEAASVIKFIDFPVSHYTGTPQINIPIASIEEHDQVMASISLSYHASGIRVSEVAESVGLGWKLNAGGMITRQVQGIPDDASHCTGFLTFRQNNTYADVQNQSLSSTSNEAKMDEYSGNVKDIESDEFYFSFNGYEGKFAFDWTPGALPVLSSSSPIKIVSFTQDPGNKKITSWELMDGYGVKYTFAAVEQTSIVSWVPSSRLEGFCSGNHAYNSGWHLTKVTSPKTNYYINFEYESYSYNNQNYIMFETCSSGGIFPCPQSYAPPGSPAACNDPSGGRGNFAIIGKRLRRIVNSTEKFEILLTPTTTDRTDAPSSGLNFKSIESVTLNYSGQLVSKYNFAYFYQGGRLMLQSLEEEGANSEKLPKYAFTYDNGVLQNYNSRAIDHWGYQNNNPVNSLTPNFFGNFNGIIRPVPGADRNPNFDGTKAQVLEKITFPNGGHTQFVYEQNDCSYIGQGTVADKQQYNTTVVTENVSVVATSSSTTVVEKPITINGNGEVVCNYFVNGSTWAFTGAYANAPRAYIKNDQGVIIHSWRLDIAEAGVYDPPRETTFSSQVFLLAGNYTIGCQARIIPGSGGADNIVFELTFDQIVPASPIIKQTVGGLRIKEIKSYDPLANQTLSKQYSYADETQPGYSSGVIYSDPVYFYERKYLYFLNSCTLASCSSVDVVGTSRIAVGATAGSHIGYRYVVETIGAAQDGGKIAYNFSSPREYMDNISPVKPFPRPETQSYKTGLLTRKRLYSKTNDLVYQEDLQYAFKETSVNIAKISWGEYDRGVSGNPGPGTCGDPYSQLPGNERWAAAFTQFKMGYAQVQSKTESHFYGTNAVERITDYTYDSELQLLKSTTIKDLSIGYEWRQTTTYPRDYGCAGCTSSDPNLQTLTEMNVRHLLNYPVEQASWFKKPGFNEFRLLSAQFMDYGSFGGYDNIQPKILHQISTATPLSDFVPSYRNSASQLVRDSRYEKEYSYAFDPNTGKLLEQHRDVAGSDVKNQYIWGHERRIPVASVMNANANEVAYSGFEEVGEAKEKNGNWTITSPGGGWTAAENDVSVGYHSFYIGSEKTITADNLPNGQQYIISFWHRDGTINVNGTALSTAGGTWTYHESTITVTGGTVNVTGDNTYALIDELRLYPHDALMQTFSYDDARMLLRGVANEQGTFASSEYDNFRRLKAMRDLDRNIRQTYEYNYAAPGTALNNVKTRAILKPEQNFATALTLTGADVIRQFSYFDGLGRPVQTNRIAQSPTSKDVIMPVQYDIIGRQTKEYIPYTMASNGGAYRSGAIAEQLTFANGFGAGGFPYSEVQYDNSPLNRITAKAAPGATWHMGTANKMTFAYRGNIAVDEVYNFYGTGYYAENALHVVEETDENGKKRLTFTDKQGRVVLLRQQLPLTLTGNAGTDWANTYSVYDDFGRESAVIPPEAAARMRNSGNWDYNNVAYEAMIYRYQYDERSRLVSKTVPSGGTTSIAYDRLDRPVLTTDAKGFRMFTRYDRLNRPVMTGRYKDAAAPGTNDPLFEVPVSTGPHYYSNTTFPTDNNIDVYKIIYYDDYDLDNNGVLDANETYVNPAEPEHLTAAYPWQRGKAVASKVAVLPTNPNDAPSVYLITRSYYDRFGNLIQANKQNHLGGRDIVSNAYDFANRAVKSRRDHTATPPGGSPISHTIREAYTYDHAGRLRFHRHRLNEGGSGNIPVILSAPQYDELDRLIDKGLHSRTYSGIGAPIIGFNYNFIQSVDYTYNIRGWLTGINSLFACNQPDDDQPDMFGMDLSYEAPSIGGGTPQYNGNISVMRWRANCGLPQAYLFRYDAANRLTEASHRHYDAANTWVNGNRYNENNIAYDLNGNLKTYTRQGLVSHTFGEMDNLIYNYDDASRPDRLTRIDDSGSADKGFVYKTTASTPHYEYDDNGNLTHDRHKDCVVTYNHLNLPTQITKNGRTLILTYTADGEKLTKHATGAPVKNYVSGIEYTDFKLAAIYHAEGRCTPTNTAVFNYEYSLKDHLGNTRVNFQVIRLNINNVTWRYLDETHYYPFGLPMEGVPPAITPFEDEYLVGDWDGNGTDNIAIRRGSAILMDTNNDGAHDLFQNFGNGNTEDQYLVGDWNGDGRDNIAVRRGNEIIMDYNYDGNPDQFQNFGAGSAEDEYLVGDWDGDGRDNIAVRRSNEVIMDTNFDWEADQIQYFGAGNAEDQYLVGDWNGDGTDNIAVRRGHEIIMDTDFDWQADQTQFFGNGNTDDQYLSGNWDGAGGSNIAVRRGTEFIKDYNYDGAPDAFQYFGVGTLAQNPYLYNGKELNEDFGIDWYDYGARWYDGAGGRWGVVDPLGELYSNTSGYNYVLNNPLSNIDPNGMTTISTRFYDNLNSAISNHNRNIGQQERRDFFRSQRPGGLSTLLPQTPSGQGQNQANVARAGGSYAYGSTPPEDILQIIIWPGGQGDVGHTAVRVNNFYYGYYPTDLNGDSYYDKNDLKRSPGEMHIQNMQEFVEAYEDDEVYIANIDSGLINVPSVENSLKWVSENPGFYKLLGSNCTSVAVHCLQRGGLYIRDINGEIVSGYATYPQQLLTALALRINSGVVTSVSPHKIGSFIIAQPK